MRTKTQDRRLLKLISFLETLPPENFNFVREVTDAKSNGHVCSTVACAIGWCGEVFPKIVETRIEIRHLFNGEPYPYFLGFFLKINPEKCLCYQQLANHLFGISTHDAACLFTPSCQKEVHADLPNCPDYASPSYVASMLRQYRRLFPLTTKKQTTA